MVSAEQDSGTARSQSRQKMSSRTGLGVKTQSCLAHAACTGLQRVACQFSDGIVTLCGQVPSWKTDRYCIRLKVSLEAREDVWDVCRLAMSCGGVKIREYCFAYADEDQWLAALESLQFRFGAEYFESFDSAANLVHEG